MPFQHSQAFCRALKTSFVDEIDALAFSISIEENYRKLHAVYEHCFEWAKKHGASFAPEKYVLVHFTKACTN
jgi:hypothetical protein